MTKTELVREYAEKAEISIKEAGEKLSLFQEILLEKIAEGETITLLDLGKFEVRETAQRNGVNPKTKEAIIIEASKKVAYKASKLAKDTVKGLK